MAKTKQPVSNTKSSPLPVAPWLYINDPTPDGKYAAKLAALLPTCRHARLLREISERPAETLKSFKSDIYRNTIILISDDNGKAAADNKSRAASAKAIREVAIVRGCNFASINLHNDQYNKRENWGVNHLHLTVLKDKEPVDPVIIAERIYKWLFTVFTVHETLHLIADSEMKKVDSGRIYQAYKDYDYCAINQVNVVGRDKKIVLVAVVLAKPVIKPDQKVSVAIADKTGTTTLSFQYHGANASTTWDWVLALQAGQRVTFPVARQVQFDHKEHTLVTIAKLPFRTSACLIQCVGHIVNGVGIVISAGGKGVVHVGKKMENKLGHRKQWVRATEVVDGKFVKRQPFKADDSIQIVPVVEGKTDVKVFNEKGDRLWKDDDSVASTQAPSDASDMEKKL